MHLNIRNSLNLYTQKTIIEAFIFFCFWIIVLFINLTLFGGILGVIEIIDENNILFMSKLIPTIVMAIVVFKMYKNKSFIQPIYPIILFIISLLITYIFGYFYGLLILSSTTILKIR